jgi:hypothetical protein
MLSDYFLYAALVVFVVGLVWVRRVIALGKRRRNRMEKAMRTVSASSTMMMSERGERSARKEMRAGKSHIDVGQPRKPPTTRTTK